MQETDFNKAELWIVRGENYSVEVKHWVKDWGEAGRNSWNVYIYLYPRFRNFDTFKDNISSDIPVSMNWGCTYSQFYRDKDGTVTCKKYGSDYEHIHQERFSKFSTPEQAYEVFQDAMLNFDELKQYDSIQPKER